MARLAHSPCRLSLARHQRRPCGDSARSTSTTTWKTRWDGCTCRRPSPRRAKSWSVGDVGVELTPVRLVGFAAAGELLERREKDVMQRPALGAQRWNVMTRGHGDRLNNRVPSVSCRQLWYFCLSIKSSRTSSFHAALPTL